MHKGLLFFYKFKSGYKGSNAKRYGFEGCFDNLY